MNKRIILASLLGGIGMFVWSSIAHMVLPLGKAGIQEIANEQALLNPMRATLGDKSGMFIFPGMSTDAEKKGDMQEYAKKLATNPSGLLIYHPPGAKLMMPGLLTTEFLTELLQVFLAVILLAQTRLQSFAARVGFVVAIGVIAAVATNVPYWNWYGFPGAYTVSYVTMQIIGFLVAGLIAAAMIRPTPQSISTPVESTQALRSAARNLS
jgi:glycerol uptake facilitator-like aquaporin